MRPTIRRTFSLLVLLVLSGCVANCPGYACRNATVESETLAAQNGGSFLGSVVGGRPQPASLRPYHTAAPLYDSWITGLAGFFPR